MGVSVQLREEKGKERGGMTVAREDEGDEKMEGWKDR
jgi:hypothetical protein